MVGILGHNGMGKTTLLRTLISEIKANRGTIRFNGEDIARLNMFRRARIFSAAHTASKAARADFVRRRAANIGARPMPGRAAQIHPPRRTDGRDTAFHRRSDLGKARYVERRSRPHHSPGRTGFAIYRQAGEPCSYHAEGADRHRQQAAHQKTAPEADRYGMDIIGKLCQRSGGADGTDRSYQNGDRIIGGASGIHVQKDSIM